MKPTEIQIFYSIQKNSTLEDRRTAEILGTELEEEEVGTTLFFNPKNLVAYCPTHRDALEFVLSTGSVYYTKDIPENRKLLYSILNGNC